MRCAEYRDLLAAYVDGVLVPEEETLAAAHVAGCALCMRLLETERRFREALRVRLPLHPTPPALRQRVIALIETLGESRPWRARVQQLSRRPAYRVALAAVAALLGLAAVSPVLRRATPDVLAEVHDHYRQAEAQAMPLQMRTDNPTELEAYYAQLGMAPAARTVMDLRVLGFALVGGSVMNLGAGKSTMSLYHGEKGFILCHRFRAGAVHLPPGDDVDGDTFYTVKGLTVCTYRDGDIVCLMASAMPRADFMKLMAGYL